VNEDQYREFLSNKYRLMQPVGFETDETKFPSKLFPWQADLVRWTCRIGRSGLFADTGLGKTPMQLAWAEQVVRHENKPVIILCPLAVAQQTVQQADKFDIGVKVSVCREMADIEKHKPDVVVTNYDRLHLFDVDDFVGVVLDEGSILKNYAGKTRTLLIDRFRKTKYRLIATATPAPNDHNELGNHAEFLGVLTRLEMLANWFKHDSGETQKWRLRGHAERDFWRWLASWAACITAPSDLGYPDDGFALPELKRHVHEVSADNCPPPEGQFWHTDSVSATKMHGVKRLTADARAAKVADLINGDDEQWLIWVDTDYEADAVKRAVEDAVEVRGSHKTEKKEEALFGFANGQIKRLITKPEIAGYGLNLQNCNRMAFAGMSFSFERTYQAIRRCWRYGQTRPVDAHFITSDAESTALSAVESKECAFKETRKKLIESVREHQKANIYRKPRKQETKPVETHEGNGWTLHHGDVVDGIKLIQDESVGFSIYSPPFATLFTYSDSHEDMGNCHNYEEFFDHFAFLVPELYRVMMPGRTMAVHCMDLPTTKQHDGFIGARDFPGDLIRSFQSAGFIYHARICIWKDPLLAAVRTHTIGLAHQQLVKDSAICRTGWPDYIVVMRKPGENPKPISHPDGLTHYTGEIDPGAEAQGEKRSHHRWRGYASPVWMDIRQTRTLNGELGKREARDEKDEAHVCPLQLDVIERCLELWSAEDDLVFSPFTGIGSEGYCSVRMGRRFVGCELKDSYVNVAVKNLRQAEAEAKEINRTLF